MIFICDSGDREGLLSYRSVVHRVWIKISGTGSKIWEWHDKLE